MTDLMNPDSATDESAADPESPRTIQSSYLRRFEGAASLRLASEMDLAIVAHALSLEAEAPDLFETRALQNDGESSTHLGPKAALVLASAVRRRLAQQALGIANRNPRRVGKLLRKKSS
ncbi:MAG: hypothetical protein JJ959_05890 [Nisaea sp.]|jgi:hypothetical protein|uniref:hypothetical protein n=1 Tax=Nisaea sp. TaxID=2024842 RepID=UPI001B0FED1B|nr:hypothetical protein [Nisaea sp.]MBO6560046.1 hypothetical protein [Nisaea sp.]